MAASVHVQSKDLPEYQPQTGSRDYAALWQQVSRLKPILAKAQSSGSTETRVASHDILRNSSTDGQHCWVRHLSWVSQPSEGMDRVKARQGKKKPDFWRVDRGDYASHPGWDVSIFIMRLSEAKYVRPWARSSRQTSFAKHSKAWPQW